MSDTGVGGDCCPSWKACRPADVHGAHLTEPEPEREAETEAGTEAEFAWFGVSW